MSVLSDDGFELLTVVLALWKSIEILIWAWNKLGITITIGG